MYLPLISFIAFSILILLGYTLKQIFNSIYFREKKWKRFLGFKVFLDLQTLMKKLASEYDENFDTAESQIILFERDLKIWLISNNDKIWFVLDNGKKIKKRTVLRSDLKFKIEDFVDKPNYGKLFVENIEMPIIFDKSFSGSTITFIERLNNLKN